MRPSQYAVRSGPEETRKWFVLSGSGQGLRKPTGSPVGFYVVVIYRFADIVIPIPSAAMRPDAELLIERLPGSRVERDIDKIQAPVSRKFDVYHFFNLPIDSVYTSYLLVASHTRPFLM
jgi:hypothetical protein